MTTVLLDPNLTDDARRRCIYAGDLVVYSPSPESVALCEFARALTRKAFPGLDPELAQHHMPVEKYAKVLAELKPQFIHHEESKRLICRLLRSLRCDETKTYFDVPRLRTSTSDEYLTTGIAYAFHPHRDTWYSAPMCQINFWMPVFDLRPDNAMAFHPQYWSTALPNGSDRYDYQRWNTTNRFNAVEHLRVDTREQPKALVHVSVEQDLRVITPVGGILMFSAAHLHSSLPNRSGRTRFSVDFRIVNVDDAGLEIGAPNVDSYCTGTTMRDYLRASDLCHVDEKIVARYMPGHPQRPAESSSA